MKVTLTPTKAILVVILIMLGLGCHYLGEKTIGSTPVGHQLIQIGDYITCLRFISCCVLLVIIFFVLTAAEKKSSKDVK